MASKNKIKKIKNNDYSDEECIDFVSIVTHQFRTPFTYIKWTLESIMDREGLDRDYKKQLDGVYATIDRVFLLLNNLSNFSHIERGDLTINKKKVNAIEVIDNSIKLFQPDIERKKQRVVLASYDPVVVDIDPMMICEAVKNILDNAVKYGSENSSIEISFYREGKNCIVAIHNNGPKISESDKGRIFAKFYRGINVRNGFNGSGIGLYVAKALIEANGGKIWYESDENGTTFYFSVSAA